jgi:hypothetical protein
MARLSKGRTMNDTDNLPVTLLMTLGDANLILEALSEMPFKRVANLVKLIHSQATPQVTSTAPEGLTDESAD